MFERAAKDKSRKEKSRNWVRIAKAQTGGARPQTRAASDEKRHPSMGRHARRSQGLPPTNVNRAPGTASRRQNDQSGEQFLAPASCLHQLDNFRRRQRLVEKMKLACVSHHTCGSKKARHCGPIERRRNADALDSGGSELIDGKGFPLDTRHKVKWP